MLRISIEGEPKEIATLVLELQGRPMEIEIGIDGPEIANSAIEAIRDMYEGIAGSLGSQL